MSNLSSDLSTIFGSNNNLSRVTVVKRDKSGEEVTYTKEFAHESQNDVAMKAADKPELKKDTNEISEGIYSSIPTSSVFYGEVAPALNPFLVNAFNADIQRGKAEALNAIRNIELAGRLSAENSDASTNADTENQSDNGAEKLKTDNV